MESPNKIPEPMSDEEKEAFLERISKGIEEAVKRSDPNTAHLLRRQLIEAVENDRISVKDAINAALTPFIKKR